MVFLLVLSANSPSGLPLRYRPDELLAVFSIGIIFLQGDFLRMKKRKSKPVSYKDVQKNKKLGDFIKEEVIDKTKETSKVIWAQIMKLTKKK